MTRQLDGKEKALWDRLIATVKPLHPLRAPSGKQASARHKPNIAAHKSPPSEREVRVADNIRIGAQYGRTDAEKLPPKPTAQFVPATVPYADSRLDGGWDRRIGRGIITPDIRVDLHGEVLSRAYARLDGTLEQAIATGMRVILLITGRPRAHDRASGEGRGAIAAVVRDWLAASRHAGAIAAVRNAHPRHGGGGALYIILKRRT